MWTEPSESKAKSLSSSQATYLRHFVIVTESCDTLGSNGHHLQFRNSPGDGILLFALCKWEECLLYSPCFVALPRPWVLLLNMAQLEFRSASIYFFIKVYFVFIYVFVCVHMCAGTYGGRKRVSDSLEEEL